MTVIEPYTPWLDRPVVERWSDTGAPADIQAIGFPSIEFVRLTWSPVQGATRYTVYRTIVDPEGGPLGLPLGNVIGEGENSYEDRIDLEQRRYWYSVEATFSDGSTTSSTQPVDVAAAATVAGAIESGWVEPDTELQPGDTLRTPWHPLGTDYLGRDMLARLMKGAQISLFIGIVAPLLFILLGVVYGSFAGFVGGKTDALLMRFADFGGRPTLPSLHDLVQARFWDRCWRERHPTYAGRTRALELAGGGAIGARSNPADSRRGLHRRFEIAWNEDTTLNSASHDPEHHGGDPGHIYVCGAVYHLH